MEQAFRRWKDVEGRSGRGEFWAFTCLEIILVIFSRVLVAFAKMSRAPNSSALLTLLLITSIIVCLILLVMAVPGLTLSIRRLHDVGRSGWWLLLRLTGIGNLVLLYWYIQPSQQGDNHYGSEPEEDD